MHTDLVIVLCTRITDDGQTNKALANAIQSIKQHVGLDASKRLVIVDSNSADKSYMDEYKEDFIHIEDIGNKNYEAGAWYHAYKKYIAKRYLFLHDSTVLTGPLDQFENSTVGLYRYEDSWTLATPEERQWAEEALLDTEWKRVPDKFTMVLGSIFYAQKVVLDYLDSKGAFKHLPTDK